MFKRFGRNLFASKTSMLCIVVLIVGALMLAEILFLSSWFQAPEQSEQIDPAGLSEQEDPKANNSVNFTQLPDTSFIYDVAIEDLRNADNYLDGQTVQVKGEVVGDRIIARDGTHCWITLQSLANTDSQIAIYMTIAASEGIDTYGAYGKRGTQLNVRGVFHMACRDHDGISDLLAEDVTVLSKGEVKSMPFEPRRIVPGILLVMAGCALILLYNFLRERQR